MSSFHSFPAQQLCTAAQAEPEFYQNSDLAPLLLLLLCRICCSRFPFRAVLIDTGRHYLPVPLIRAHIDAMAYNKMNVLHWHIVDMPSFPFVSKSFPNLSAEGAFDARHVYTPADVAGLVDYAQHRGVRIVPEFDVRRSLSRLTPATPLRSPLGVSTGCDHSLLINVIFACTSCSRRLTRSRPGAKAGRQSC